MSGFLDFLGAGLDALNIGYKAYTNKRDFDYQKDLQSQIFGREDNAVQRRVADLEAAGLNPALAMGSAASAGSVVGRSNTDDLGGAIDNLMAVQQMRLQRQETENAKQELANKQVQNQILKDQQYVTDNEKYISMANTLYDLGIPFQTNVKVNPDHTFSLYVGTKGLKDGYNYNFNQEGSPLFKSNNSTLNQLLTSEELLNKDANWYTADKISGMAFGLLNSLPLHINLSNIKRR